MADLRERDMQRDPMACLGHISLTNRKAYTHVRTAKKRHRENSDIFCRSVDIM